MRHFRLVKILKTLLNTNSSLPIYFLIFCSGFSSLIYEIAWIRQASFVFGSSALALSTVLAIFFLGLGLGSFIFGRMSTKIQHPLLWCAGLECVLALNGFASQSIFNATDGIYGQIYRSFDPSSNELLVLRACLVTLILLLPTICMGGTLPLFCKQLILDSGKVSSKLSLIYGFNTFGAAIGCLLTGFLFLPRLGLATTLLLAVFVNIMTGLGFWQLQRKLIKLPDVKKTVTVSPITLNNKPPIRLAGVLFFMIGAAALANELIWARFLTHFIRHSIYTYTLALSVVLIGTAWGSIWLGPKLDRTPNRSDLFSRFALLQVTSALIIQALTHLPIGFWQAIKTFGILPFIILMLPSAIIAGASFPLINRLASQNFQLAARQVGQLASLNIVGCIFGSLITGYVLLPHHGLDVSISSSTTWSMATALLALWFGVNWRIAENRPKPATYLSIYGLLLVWFGLLIFPPLLIPQDFIASNEKLIDMTEGYNSNLAVVMRGEEKTLLVDRLWQGIGNKNYQIMVAHVPMFHYPDAKDILVIGLGAGTTASRFLYYDINRLDIVDIEPRLFEFTRKHFDSTWMDDPRVRMLSEDGRNYIKHSNQQYDLVSVEIGQLDRPGVGIFYTQEFYQEVYARLRPNGMVSQFVPLPFLRTDEFAGIIKTFLATFPNAQLWYNTEELLLQGFKGDIRRVSPQGFAKLTANPIIKDDININYWGGSQYNLTRFPAFLSGFLASGQDLKALSNITPAEIYTDDKLQLSYTVNNYKRSDRRSLTLTPYLQKNLTNMDAAIEPDSTDARTLLTASQIRGFNVADIAASDLLSQLHSSPSNLVPSAKQSYELAIQALQWNPHSLEAQIKLQNALYELNPEREN